jgi:cytochrome-b5 reductase
MSSGSQKRSETMRKIPQRGNGSSLVAFQKFLKSNKNPNVSFEPGITTLTMEEVEKHNSPNDCWTVYRGYVYNITPFLDFHPGGADELFRGAGQDCTELYNKYHAWVNADAVMGKLRLGKLQIESTHKVVTRRADWKPTGSAQTSEGRGESVRVSKDGSALSEPIVHTGPLTSYSGIQRVGIFRAFSSIYPLIPQAINR